MVTCPPCDGTGVAADTTHKYQCEWCLGFGKINKKKLESYFKHVEYLELYEAYKTNE